MAETGLVIRKNMARSRSIFLLTSAPWGCPDGVKRAIAAAAETADRYPDPLCRSLCRKLAVHEQVPEQYVLCGNGAADLIFRAVLAKKPKKALLPRRRLLNTKRL